MSQPPLLRRQDNDYQYDRTTYVHTMMRDRDGFDSIFVHSEAGWTHNQLLKKQLQGYNWEGEVAVGVKRDAQGMPEQVITLTAMQDGFPRATSRIKVRKLREGKAQEMDLEDYLRIGLKGPSRTFSFVYNLDAYRRLKGPENE